MAKQLFLPGAVICCIACATPFFRNEAHREILPAPFADKFASMRCSGDSDCQGEVAGAQSGSGRCAAGYCSFRRDTASAWRCYYTEVEWCSARYEGNPCNYGMKFCDETFGFVDWSRCAPTPVCKPPKCTMPNGHPGEKLWGQNGWSPCLRTLDRCGDGWKSLGEECENPGTRDVCTGERAVCNKECRCINVPQ